MGFYQNYESVCKEKGIEPQSKEMREIAGVSNSTMSYWKKYDKAPSNIEIIEKLANHLSVSVERLMGKPETSLTNQEIDMINKFKHLSKDHQSLISKMIDELSKIGGNYV